MKKITTHYAKAKCKDCGDVIESLYGGDFQKCSCGESFIDQERHEGRWVRIGGLTELVERKCPPGCKLQEHTVGYTEEIPH